MYQPDWERLFREIGRLIETMPALDASKPTTDDLKWLGAAYALVSAVNSANGFDAIKLASAMDNFGSGTMLAYSAPSEIRSIVYRALAVAQQHAPASAVGSFIASGGSFDALVALAKVFRAATRDVLLLDAYMDETALTDFAVMVPEGVGLRLLTDQADRKPGLEPAARRWQQQYGQRRPIQLRLAAPKALHDRAIFVDGKVWLVSQSFNAIAKRSPATIHEAGSDIAAAKLTAYEAIWSAAQVVT